jgi:hypothetical protein
MKVEILMSPGCGHGRQAVELVADIVQQNAPGAEVKTIIVATDADAAHLAFPGSPTVRINGVDVEQPPPRGVGLG